MNTRGLLDQLLKSGQEMLQNKSGGKPGASGGGQLGSLLSGAGGGALAAGAIGLLLGNKKARKFGGKAITYGGLAALGVIAYKACRKPRPKCIATRSSRPSSVRPRPTATSTSANGR